MVHIIMQRKKSKNIILTHTYILMLSLSVIPKIGNLPLTFIFGIVISTSSVNRPRLLKRGNKRAIFPINNNQNSILHTYRCRLYNHPNTRHRLTVMGFLWSRLSWLINQTCSLSLSLSLLIPDLFLCLLSTITWIPIKFPAVSLMGT